MADETWRTETGRPIKHMDIAEFRKLGYLHEVNRRFLHPLGLALEVVIDSDGSETLGGVWDFRDDPEGIAYGPELLDADKANFIKAEEDTRRPMREKGLGHWIQPVDSPWP